MFCLSHHPSKRKSTNSAELTVLPLVPETGQNPAPSSVLAVSLVKIRFTKTRRTDKLSKNPFYKLRFLTCFLRCSQQTLFPKSSEEMLSKHPLFMVLLGQCQEGKASVFHSIVMRKEELQHDNWVSQWGWSKRAWKLTCGWYLYLDGK